MKNTRWMKLGVVALAASFTVIGCTKQEEPAPVEAPVVEEAPVAEAPAADTAATAATDTTAAPATATAQ